VDHVRPRSTVDHGGAARSTVARPPELGLQPLRLAGAREKVERWHDSGEGSGGGALGTGLIGVRREGKGGGGRSGEERGCRDTLF
jgi:hypothetical protein